MRSMYVQYVPPANPPRDQPADLRFLKSEVLGAALKLVFSLCLQV